MEDCFGMSFDVMLVLVLALVLLVLLVLIFFLSFTLLFYTTFHSLTELCFLSLFWYSICSRCPLASTCLRARRMYEVQNSMFYKQLNMIENHFGSFKIS